MRAERTQRRLTRNQLAERSRVSLRYLAQLEAGQGNISLGVLHRIAQALETAAHILVGGGAPPPARARRIALIGLRGAGKTTLGRLLAESLDWPFVELNREIETLSGLAVNEVIALYGQDGYRRLERQAVERAAAAHENVVLAAAGGLVTEPETFRFVQTHFHTIWLKAAPHEHMNRVRAQGDERPMAGHPQAMAALNALLGEREALYASAHATLDTSGAALIHSHHALLSMVRGLGL